MLSAVEAIRQISTYLVAWRSTLEPDPETNRFGVDSERVQGALTLTVLDNRLPIPPAVLDCADQFGVDVRGAGSAAGSTIAWTPTNMARADLSVLDTASAVVDDNQKAEYHYITGQESKKAAEGDEHAGLLKLVSSVHRNDIEKVRKLFTALVFDQIPSSIRGIVERIAGPLLDAATTHLTSITDVRATGYVAITFHGEKPPEEPTPVESTPAAKTWQGQWQSSKYELAGTFTLAGRDRGWTNERHYRHRQLPVRVIRRNLGVANAGSVTFGSVEAGNEIQFEGTISADGTTMQGTYSDGAACGDDVGSWSASRTSD